MNENDDLAAGGVLLELREAFENNRQRSASTMGRATWGHARDMVDERLTELGVDTSGLRKGQMKAATDG